MVAVGAVSGGSVGLALSLAHTFDTSNDKRKKGIKTVTLTIIFFVAVTFGVIGMSCAPVDAIRGAPAAFRDVEVSEINLQVINDDVPLPVYVCVARRKVTASGALVIFG